MKHIILLTSCVNPNGMPFTALSDIDVRKQQYLDALWFYINNTSLPIVYVDNSNFDIEQFKIFHANVYKRLELLSFEGNSDKVHGKGYGELEIIDYAIRHSEIINKNKDVSLIKITGRLKITNINGIIKQIRYRILPYSNSIICSMNSDFSMADSRLIIAPISFYEKLVERKADIFDFKGIYLEHILSILIKSHYTNLYHPFLIEPQFEGVSGSTSTVYNAKEHTIIEKIIYAEYVISQWLSLLRFHNILYTNIFKIIVLTLLRYMFILFIKVYYCRSFRYLIRNFFSK